MTDAPDAATSTPVPEPLLKGPLLWFMRVSVGLIWIAGVASTALDFPYAELARWLMIAVGVIHVFEAFVLLPKLASMGEPPARHAIPVLIFGTVHYFALPGTRPGS